MLGFHPGTETHESVFHLLAHYTFSKFLDDVEASKEFGSTGSYMDAYNRRLDKGRSGSDVPQRLVVSALVQLPQLQGNRLTRTALGGWKFGVLETAESGPTFTVVTSANTTSAFPAGLLRPDLIDDPTLASDQRTANRWFNTAAFVNPPALIFGNSPRGGLRAAPVIMTDATIEKSFALREAVRLEVRGEFYNLLNHAIFNIPGFTLGAADFGVVSSARSPRTAQIAAKLSF